MVGWVAASPYSARAAYAGVAWESVYVDPEAQGQGIGRRLLEHLIAEARRRGYARLSLETGSGPAFEPALELYRKYGFTEGEAFNGYEKSPFNQFLHLDLI